jgi:hypothetical protein
MCSERKLLLIQSAGEQQRGKSAASGQGRGRGREVCCCIGHSERLFARRVLGELRADSETPDGRVLKSQTSVSPASRLQAALFAASPWTPGMGVQEHVMH